LLATIAPFIEFLTVGRGAPVNSRPTFGCWDTSISDSLDQGSRNL